MKYILAIMLALPMTAKALEPDKKLHIGASAAISGALYVYARSEDYNKAEAYAIAFIGTMAVGFAKELADDRIDKKDIYADMTGALVAPLVLIWF